MNLESRSFHYTFPGIIVLCRPKREHDNLERPVLQESSRLFLVFSHIAETGITDGQLYEKFHSDGR